MLTAFDLLAQYAERQHWIPIGWKVFRIGPWQVTVNGTAHERDKIPPYHALIAHDDVVAFLLLSPLGGVMGGWLGAEDQFIADLEAALRA